MKNPFLYLFVTIIFIAPLLVVPFTGDSYNTPKNIFIQLSILLCLLLWIKNILTQDKIDIVASKFYLFLFGFALTSVLSLLWAENFYFATRSILQIFIFAAAFIIAANTVKPDKIRFAVSVALIAGFLSAAYGILQYFGFDLIGFQGAASPDWKWRASSTFGDPNFLADYLMLIFPVGVALYLSSPKIINKFFFLFMLTVIYAALLITFSIGALI